MDEYIKKADVLEYLSARRNQVLKSPLSTLAAKFEVMEIFDFVDHRVESADVAPVRKGRWESVGLSSLKCSDCGYLDDMKMYHRYCPDCGCFMR